MGFYKRLPRGPHVARAPVQHTEGTSQAPRVDQPPQGVPRFMAGEN